MTIEPKAVEKKFIESFHVKPQYYQDLPILMGVVDSYDRICQKNEVFTDFTILEYLNVVSTFLINIKVEKEYIDCIEIRYIKNENDGLTFFCCLSSSGIGFDMITTDIINFEDIIINLFNSVINKILS